MHTVPNARKRESFAQAENGNMSLINGRSGGNRCQMDLLTNSLVFSIDTKIASKFLKARDCLLTPVERIHERNTLCSLMQRRAQCDKWTN